MLDRFLDIEKKSVTKNDLGEQVVSFDKVATIKGELLVNDEASSPEEYQSKREVNNRETVFRIRYKSWLNPTDYRVRYEGRVFDLIDVREEVEKFRRQYQKIKVERNE
jgi:SPP1 family predicted phage head-tail adaptor